MGPLKTFVIFGRSPFSNIAIYTGSSYSTAVHPQPNILVRDSPLRSNERGIVYKKQNEAPEKKAKQCCMVIFDMNGTLLDTELMNQEAHDWYLNKYNKKLPMDIKVKVMGSGDIYGAKAVISGLDMKITPEQYVHGVWQKKRQLYQGGVSIMPGAEALICHFARFNIPMALVTSNNKKAFELITRSHKKFLRKFNHIVMGDDLYVKHNKPAPDIYREAVRRFSVPPKSMDSVLVIEDSPNGVKAAKLAGTHVVMVPEPSLPGEYRRGADDVVKDLISFAPEHYGFPRIW